MKKRILAAVTAAALTIPAVTAPVYYCPASAFTAIAAETPESVTEGDLTFNVYSDHAEAVKSSSDVKGQLTIPEEVNGVPVTVICKVFNKNRAEVTGVTIPDSVTTIEQNAFEECENLKEVTGGKGVTSVGYSSFNGTGWLNDAKLNGTPLTLGHVLINPGGIAGKYTVPAGITSIYDSAFSNKYISHTSTNYTQTNMNDLSTIRISALVLPDGFERIEGNAFGEIAAPLGTVYNAGSLNKAGSIYVPKSVCYIDASSVSNIKDIWYAGTEEEWKTIEIKGTLPENLNIRYNVEQVPASADEVSGDLNSRGYTMNEVHSLVADENFIYCVFSDHIIISGPVDKDISGELVIPDEFDGKPVTAIWNTAFKEKDITSVRGGSNIEAIGWQAFDKTPWLQESRDKFTERIIGKVIVTPGGVAGRYTVPEGIVSFYPDTLYFATPEKNRPISYFYADSVKLPEGFKWLNMQRGICATDNGEVFIPHSVGYIAGHALENCKEIWYEGTEEEWDVLTASVKLKEDVVIHFGADKMPEPDNSSMSDIIKYGIQDGLIPNAVHSFGTDGMFDYAVYADQATVIGLADKEYAGDIVIPSELDGKPVTGIYSEAFKGAAITSVEIPDTVTGIFSGAFDDCTQLAEVKGGKNVSVLNCSDSARSILSDTPWYSEKVLNDEPVILGNVLIYAGPCTGDYVMPENITAVEGSAFKPYVNGHPVKGVLDPASVTFSDGIKYIPRYILATNEKVSDVYIPASVEKIEKSAFVFNEREGSGVKDIWYAGTPALWTEISGDLKVPAYVTVHFGAESIGDENAAIYTAGDTNCDGKVNVADAVGVLQFIANATKYPLSAGGMINADCDGDLGITGTDAITIQKIDAGILSI